jgi:hypothetical protein
MLSSFLSRTSLSALLALSVPVLASATSFTDIGATVTNAHHGSSIWGDYDGDLDLDYLVTGEQPGLTPYADVYNNNPLGTFTAIGAGLTGITGSNNVSRSAWGDFDNDGDLDVIITGLSGTGVSTTLYRNTAGAFAPVTVTPSALVRIGLGSAAWGDYDNDGDLDLFITGYNGITTLLVTTVYRNDGDNGSGGWTFVDTNPFGSIAGTARGWSDGAWGDYDNDGDLDLAVEGFTDLGSTPSTKLYRNDGGVLVPSSVNNLINVGEGSVTWGDVNNDNWLDLVVTGSQWLTSMSTYCNVYTNNHDGTFTLSATLAGVSNSSAALGDYNNDGKLDLVTIGKNFGTPFAFAYFGNGAGGFTLDPSSGLFSVYEGQVAFGDYDNDGRLDLIITGRDATLTGIFTKIYHNTTGVSANTLPTVPGGLVATAVTWNSITVQWNLATDAQSGNHLSYNLKVRDITAGTTVESPMADAGGYRYVPALGNANLNTSWTIGGLISGHQYQICVQSIDQAYAASAFNCGVTVTTTSDRPDVMIGDCLADVGTEPNAACGTVYFNSPNIWLRKLPDGTLPGNDVSQSPVAGGTNYVYARVKNIGTALMTHGRVYFYFAKAATAFNWSYHWAGHWVGTSLEGDLIGYADVNLLSGGGGTTIVGTSWPNTPGFSHFCILARFVAASDPMTYPEGITTTVNTQNNNNIAWRNITVGGGGGFGGGVFTGTVGTYNTRDAVTMVDLHVAVPIDEAGDPLLNHVKVKYILGDALFNRWQGAGGRGRGIEIVQPGANGQQEPAVWINTTDAAIEGIPYNPNEEFSTNMEFSFPAQVDQNIAGRIYHLNLSQYDNGDIAPIGGEYYEITMPGGPNGPGNKSLISVKSFSNMLELVARPNPTSSGTTIGYTLPGDSRVTISLFDAGGKLVRTLVDGDEQAAGHHEIEWDGASADGAPVPSGAYFYRVRTARGTAQGQIKIVR